MDPEDAEIGLALCLAYLASKNRRKRKRKMWMRDLFYDRSKVGEFNRVFRHITSAEHRDDQQFFNYMRMSYTSFEELKTLLLPHLESPGTNYRSSISPQEKLVLTIRHLATGASFASMASPFAMSKASISLAVHEVCAIMWKVLQPLELPFPTEVTWRSCAQRYAELWDYPFAMGALDGKHIALINPKNAHSMYYNYKGFPSIVLLALSDADLYFRAIDCGQYGRISDAGVFQRSKLSKLLTDEQLNIPPETMQVLGKEVPFLFVGDEAFPLTAYLMRPYPARTLDDQKRIYNYRHSRARLTVECAFGILAKKFEVFMRPMRVEPDRAVTITEAAVCLHNFIRRRDGKIVDRTSEISYEPSSDGQGLFNMAPQSGGRLNQNAVEIRDSIKDFFNDPAGSVSWQNDYVFRNIQPMPSNT